MGMFVAAACLFIVVELIIRFVVQSPILRFAARYFVYGFGGTAFLLICWNLLRQRPEKKRTGAALGSLVAYFFAVILMSTVYRLMFFEVPRIEMLIGAMSATGFLMVLTATLIRH